MDGWLTVLDPIDDLLMCHDVKFKISNPQDDVEGYRVAWIMRWLGQPQDFLLRPLECVERRICSDFKAIGGGWMTCSLKG